MKIYLHSSYSRKKDIVFLWEFDTVTKEVEYSEHNHVPYFFLKCEEETILKSPWRDNVEKQEFHSYREMERHLEEIKKFRFDEVFENDVSPSELQFLVERYDDIPIEDRLIDKQYIDVRFIDIETYSSVFPDVDSAPDPINLITVYNCITKIYNIYTYKDPKIELPRNIRVIHCKDEEHMLKLLWRDEINKGFIISGWYSNNFDFPYIINRSKRLGVKNNGYCRKLSKGDYHVSVFGKILIDYLEIYKKFSYQTIPSYKLAVVAEIEKLEKKKIVFPDDARGNHMKMYDDHFEQYFLYNLRDVEVMVNLEAKYDFFTMLLTLTTQSLCALTNLTKMVRLIESFLIQFMRKENLVMPSFTPGTKVKYPGAFVKQPIPGKYGWIMDFDVVSMYPTHTILCNISNETYLGKLIGIDENGMGEEYDMFKEKDILAYMETKDEVNIIK